MLNIALPKGRLGDTVYALFDKIGYGVSGSLGDDRKLIVEDPDKNVRYLLVKPSDVAVYVEHGAADIGVVGKDILMEQPSDIFELLDLRVGKCRFAVAGKKDFVDDPAVPLRIATSFPHVTQTYYRGKNRQIEIIELHGSIELAPLVGLSDVIVDIVETGSTLRENNLHIIEEIAPISARLICNKSSYHFQLDSIQYIVKKLTEEIES
ncbi:MAG: ATP phosphoribosyltransferase [Clostridia bacterium]|nr:ATP phosphoribosyltransferase [Clostridia bacterium]